MSRDRRRWMRHGLEELPMRRRAVLESSTDDERGQRQERKTPLPEQETFERPRDRRIPDEHDGGLRCNR